MSDENKCPKCGGHSYYFRILTGECVCKKDGTVWKEKKGK